MAAPVQVRLFYSFDSPFHIPPYGNKIATSPCCCLLVFAPYHCCKRLTDFYELWCKHCVTEKIPKFHDSSLQKIKTTSKVSWHKLVPSLARIYRVVKSGNRGQHVERSIKTPTFFVLNMDVG